MDTRNRLSAIATGMGQLQDEIQARHIALNFLLRSKRTIDLARKKAPIHAAREHIQGLEGRQQTLRAEQHVLIEQIIFDHKYYMGVYMGVKKSPSTHLNKCL